MPFLQASLPRKLALTFVGCYLVFLAAACTPYSQGDKLASLPSQQAEQASGDFTWSQESDCAACHDVATQSFDDSSYAASLHASMKDNCFTCHDDIAGLRNAHASVTLDSKKKKPTLKKTEISETICATCHDRVELVSATESSTVLIDKNGLIVNPHNLPVNKGHMGAGMACSSCHKVHTTEGAAEVAPGICRNCHHADIYECGTCHVDK